MEIKMPYKIDGEVVQVDISHEAFTSGYWDGISFSDLYKEPDLGVVHDEHGSNPHEPGTNEYKTYKAGFIQGIS